MPEYIVQATRRGWSDFRPANNADHVGHIVAGLKGRYARRGGVEIKVLMITDFADVTDEFGTEA